jgi:hypothetical protein
MTDLPSREPNASGHEPTKPITIGVIPVREEDENGQPTAEETAREVFSITDDALRKMEMRWLWPA